MVKRRDIPHYTEGIQGTNQYKDCALYLLMHLL
jgi:hypothetical protein